jgi:small subunit ribosomal protein S21
LPFNSNELFLRSNFEDMLSIPVKEGDNIERALKRFKKKFDRTKRMRELRTRREFVKPSVINREQRKKAIYKNGLNMKND